MSASTDSLAAARQLHRGGRFEEAVALYRQAVEADGGDAAAWNDLGDALHVLGRPSEAMEAFAQAVQRDSTHVEAVNNLGLALRALGRSDEAVVCLQHAVGLRPNMATLYSNLALALEDEGMLEGAIKCYRQSLRLEPTNATTHSNLLLALNYDPALSAAMLFEEHKRWGEAHGQAIVLPHQNPPDPDRRLKIGYVSPDYRSHPAVYFIEPILMHHDRSQFEVFGYGNVVTGDEINKRLQGHCDHFAYVWNESDNDLAHRIRTDGIDILVDLAGHTADNRLTMFARKPAPVQVTFLGYQNTTGLRAMDYRITDHLGDPPGSEADGLYVEKLVRLGDQIISFRPSAVAPPVAPLPAASRGAVSFGSHHRLIKLNAEVIGLWSRVLQETPGSRLVLFPRSLSKGAMARVTGQFKARGIDPSRLAFHHRHITGRRYLDVFDEVDVVLDAFPNGAGATAYEGMWMGAPMVTLRGDRFAGRIGASLMERVGLGEWVAKDHEDYVKIAAGAAKDPARLAAVRGSLRQRMRDGGLCDSGAGMGALEAAYRAMWRRWCDGRGG